MRQETLAGSGFEKYRKKTRKEQFLEEMDRVIPWQELAEAIEPFYPNPQGAGRRPIGIERMLRVHFLQHWFKLSDPGAEEALYDSQSMRAFVGIDLGREPVPDETTICKFRHLMEKHTLGAELFRRVNRYLKENGLRVHRGTIVDATIISAPMSTKNRQRQRDPEMRSTHKGGHWFFGMKAHIGVDSRTKLIHSVVGTSANVHDSRVIGELLHGEETRVWGDSAYTGKGEVIRAKAPRAQDYTQRQAVHHRQLTPQEHAANRVKKRVRGKVEHVFGIMKHRLGFTKVRYKGLQKNTNFLLVCCALTNVLLARRALLRSHCPGPQGSYA